jgi:hypothetical protein
MAGAVGSPVLPSDLPGPATVVSSVELPKINPAWPIGKWWSTDLTNPMTIYDCGASGQQALQQIYDLSITAGSGLDYLVTATVYSPEPMSSWTGTPSADGKFISGPAFTNTSTSSDGPSTWSQSPVTLALSNAYSDGSLTARLYMSATSAQAKSGTCSFRIDDFELNRLDKFSGLVQGTTKLPLAEPVALTRWGSFPVTGMGRGRTDESSWRHSLTASINGSMPRGITLDGKAWAIKTSLNAQWFEVIQAFTNSGGNTACFYEPEITSVENSAGLPVHTDIYSTVAAPGYGTAAFSTSCLRPGETGWIVASVSVAGGSAFGNATQIKIAAPRATSLLREPAAAPTPYQLRYASGAGVQVDVIGLGGTVRAVYLDSGGLPVGTDATHDHVPADQPRSPNLVYTYALPEPAVLGSATRVLVYASDSVF